VTDAEIRRGDDERQSAEAMSRTLIDLTLERGASTCDVVGEKL
jgi:hypothetical protein